MVWYVRVGQGPRIRMREPYDSPEFWRDYRLALEGKLEAKGQGPAPGTLSWLIARYVESAEWANNIKPATRKQRHAFYRQIESTAGGEPLRLIGTKAIKAGIHRRKDRPFAANNFLKAMRGLFQWAVSEGHVPSDPTAGLKPLTRSEDDAGFHAWTEEEVALFEAHWPLGTRQRLAFDLLLYTGLRRGDVVRLGRPHVRNGEFTIRTEKTGMVVTAPILPALAASIDASKTGELTFLATERGLPFGKESFGNWFRKACQAAKCPGSAHGLRKAGARRAAEEGATEAQLNALFGWADGSRESAVYTRTANRAKLARAARKAPAPAVLVRDLGEKA
ncbi:integrase [Methylobacterium sp. BE186]|uniref:tyrosine-type recombinase/integrase n=1 Tax=Methylobacterium sp. BE186 TaxID=2817715 RepID=UPI00285F390A|nr:tyrosine-type recombinase/integrase [Methylobacterium sp. BE186]MDR7037415.1 integrase [Methylobacterium sp. BE186]